MKYGRRPQFFLKMEDDLIFFWNGRRPQIFFENWRRPQFFENVRQPPFFLKMGDDLNKNNATKNNGCGTAPGNLVNSINGVFFSPSSASHNFLSEEVIMGFPNLGTPWPRGVNFSFFLEKTKSAWNCLKWREIPLTPADGVTHPRVCAHFDTLLGPHQNNQKLFALHRMSPSNVSTNLSEFSETYVNFLT